MQPFSTTAMRNHYEKENNRLRSTIEAHKKREICYKKQEALYNNLQFVGSWQWKDCDNIWYDYPIIISDIIESLDFDEEHHDIYHGQKIIINATTKTQLNLETGEILEIRRITILKQLRKQQKINAEQHEAIEYVEMELKQHQELLNDKDDIINELQQQLEMERLRINQLQQQLIVEGRKTMEKTHKIEAYHHQIKQYNDQINQYRHKIEQYDDDIIQYRDELGLLEQELYSERCRTSEFMQKAQSEEKQKMDKEIEYKQLKDKIEWKIKWEWKENNGRWNPYDDEISEIIEKLNIANCHQYTYWGNRQNYKITKNSKDSATQINTHTLQRREVRRIEKISGFDDVKYPSFWDKNMSQTEYAKPKLTFIYNISTEAEEIKNRFFKTMDRKYFEIIKIEAVQNRMLYDKYWNERRSMIKLVGENNLNERDLFHGAASEDTMKKIETEGFRKEFNVTSKYGKGTYFARDSQFSLGYVSVNSNGICKMFQCRVICGESHIGSNSYKLKQWPKKNNGLIYDSLVDNINNPSIFVIHENARAYPMFVIEFKRKI